MQYINPIHIKKEHLKLEILYSLSIKKRQKLYRSFSNLLSAFPTPSVKSLSPVSPMELLLKSSSRRFEAVELTAEPSALQHLSVRPQLSSLRKNKTSI